MTLLAGPQAKVERAEKHISDLGPAITAFFKTEPYAAIRKDDLEAQQRSYYAEIRAQPDLSISLIAGDAIHNLRAALDLLFSQLVKANNEEVGDSDYFPIRKSAKSLEASLPEIQRRVGSDACGLIEDMKPYQGGNDSLWHLHRLDAIDKHRFLLTALGSVVSLVLPFEFPDGRVVYIELPDQGNTFSLLEDRGHLLTLSFSKGEQDHEPGFGIEVALNEPEVVEPQPLVPFLEQLAGLVTETIALFDARF
ncbi:MAG TPA: hypothetical protein VFW80_00495 [Gaiellaceae bacterium]|nr:hypothetical protein [Gaiellaceae bacterium]